MKKFISILCLFCMINPLHANDNELFYQKLLQKAEETIGLKNFPTINGLRYNGDCSGFVSFLFHLAGLNLRELFGVGDGGTEAIWDGMKKNNFIINHKNLQAGDIVFFDNTYDKNKNGKWDDVLTHVGVVESIDKNGTITYVHYASRGVVRAKMNLKHPKTFVENGERYNDLLRNSNKKGVNPDYLAGALYRGAARIVVTK